MATSPLPTPTTGFIPLSLPSLPHPCQTYYKAFHPPTPPPSPNPLLIILHGGPGAPHNITLALAALTSTHGIPTIHYDQLGTGLSTHLPTKNRDATFWTIELFLAELDNLLRALEIATYDLYGHSWGGMLAAAHAVRRPSGLRRLVLAGTPASSRLWTEAQWALRGGLSEEVRGVLERGEGGGGVKGEYEGAMEVFYERHLCRVRPLPEEVEEGFEWVKRDPGVFLTMNGPSEFYHTGSLKDWSIVEEVHKIEVPTLLTNGRYDQAQDSVMEPFFRGIAKVKWVQFAESSHMPHVEEKERYMKVVGDFLVSE